MRIQDYIAKAAKTDKLDQTGPGWWSVPLLGIAGEIGSLLTELKKEVRESKGAISTELRVQEELGDIIWYASAIARRAGLDFQTDILFANLQKIKANYSDSNKAPAPLFEQVLSPGGEVAEALERDGVTTTDTFSSYQALAVKTSRFAKDRDRETLVPYLARITKNAADLLKTAEKSGSSLDAKTIRSVANALGDIMWYVAGFADLYRLDLDTIAEENANKIMSAFASKEDQIASPLFDEMRRPIEKFPRDFSVYVIRRDADSAVMLVNGVRVGDAVEDNAHDPDGYRYHDAIHLAFLAILGWSPVMRALLKLKRKGDKKLDAVEDGARAAIVEEMIVKLCHSYAMEVDPIKLLDEQERVSLDLLKQVDLLAKGLEVSGSTGAQRRQLWEWNKAIVQGMRVFNRLRTKGFGRIDVCLTAREITFVEISDGIGEQFPQIKIS